MGVGPGAWGLRAWVRVWKATYPAAKCTNEFDQFKLWFCSYPSPQAPGPTPFL